MVSASAGREGIRYFMAPADRQRFIEVVETELLGLHEGNIARSRLRPAEFQAHFIWENTKLAGTAGFI